MRGFTLAVAAQNNTDAILTPTAQWNGTAGTGFGTANPAAPSDPTRTTAKPVCRLLTPPNQTMTDSMVVGVLAGANNNGTMLAELGIEKVTFYLEGNSVDVTAPSFRTFTRFDGSTYQQLGWWITLERNGATEGIADLYAEAVPLDGTMQNRVIGPYNVIVSNDEFDYDVTVGTGADYTTMAAAFSALKSDNAQHPRITVTTAGNYDLGSGGGHSPAGWVRIEADAAVTFKQNPPALDGDFTRFRPSMDSLHFKGSNITIDFVETLEFYTEQAGGQHWLDGITITQSRGREDLWRLAPRNSIPSLFRNGAWFTDCSVSQVNDVYDKALLVRGCQSSETWSDLAQSALCFVNNLVDDHSSEFYYTNVDAMSIAYSGSGTPTVSIRNSPRRLVLRVDGSDVASYTFSNAEQDFRDDVDYRVGSAVDWVNTQTDWSATLIDDTRRGSSLSPPGTTNGNPKEDIAVPATLPTHFDIHSDIYQQPNNFNTENVVMAFNKFTLIDAQNIFTSQTPTGNGRDFYIFSNAFYNNLGTLDEGLRSALGGCSSNTVFVHNTMATQYTSLPQDAVNTDADEYCLFANNSVKEIRATGGLDVEVTVANNHVHYDDNLPADTTGTTEGGDSTDLYVDAIGGDFTPDGLLLTNKVAPIVPYDLNGNAFATTDAKGAVRS
jgi:hypothetical protein